MKIGRFRPRSGAFLDPGRCETYVSCRSEIVFGGDLAVIANCPACGTHFKHQVVAAPARARCGRCDATVDLSRLRPYRIVTASAPSPADTATAAARLPIGLDDPSLATRIAGRRAPPPDAPPADMPASEPAAAPVEPAPIALARVDDAWDTDDPLPSIPEMDGTDRDILGAQHVSEVDGVAPMPQPPEGRRTTFALWLLAGAIIGTGVSWTLGGTTEWGMGAGTVLGSLMGLVWLRWLSAK